MKNKTISIFQQKKELCDKCFSYKVYQMSDENYQVHVKQKDST